MTDHPSHEHIAAYVSDHAPELDPEVVRVFMAKHDRPTDERGTHLEWAVRVLRERGEGETDVGPSVDRVVNEIRRRER